MNKKVLGLVVLLSVSLSGCSSSNESANPKLTEEPVIEDVNWAPEGYKYFDTPANSQVDVHDVAYKPDDSDSGNGYGAYFGFLVMAQNGCSSLYVEANLTIDGIVEDWTNDSTSSLAPGQEARMLLQFTSDKVGDIQWTKVTCHP